MPVPMRLQGPPEPSPYRSPRAGSLRGCRDPQSLVLMGTLTPNPYGTLGTLQLVPMETPRAWSLWGCRDPQSLVSRGLQGTPEPSP